MNTKVKILLASTVSRLINTGRRAVGLSEKGVFRRGGINWQLDLNQGIDFAVFLIGQFEKDTATFYQSMLKPGAVVLDIGANIGAHTLPMARLVSPGGAVYAFEPTDYAFHKLRNNVRLNSEIGAAIVAIQTMLGEESTNKPASIPSSWSLVEDASSVVHPIHQGTFNSLSGASLETLDNWTLVQGIKRIDLIKLDVDGYEVDVFKGGMATISRYRPIVIMELAPYTLEEHGQSFRGLIDIIKQLNYGCRNFRGQELPLDDSLERKIPNGGSINVVLYPKKMAT